jgi:hypothetical protein
MPNKPKIDEVDPATDKPKYANFAEYEDAKDAWLRQETIREFQALKAKQEKTKTSSGSVILGWAFLVLLACGGYATIPWVADAIKGHSTAKASAPDARDEQIKDLTAKVAVLEAKPKAEHHYEFRDQGYRTWRFDPATGTSCIQLTTNADWKKPETIRQSCQYRDWVDADGATMKDSLAAECQLVNNKKACDQLIALASN